MNSLYLPNKYPYVEMSRSSENGRRHYVAPDGSKLPSVTTILDATKSEDSRKALHEWRKRVGAQQAQTITTEAASRGTRMHKWLENHIKSGDSGKPGSNPYSKQSHDMATHIINRGLSRCQEYWGTEINLYYPEIYAGTTDLVGVHENVPCIMDFKQSNRVKKIEWIEDYFLQLVAYADCHNALYNTNINRGVIFMCTPNLEYQEFVIEGTTFDHWQTVWLKRLEQYYQQLT